MSDMNQNDIWALERTRLQDSLVEGMTYIQRAIHHEYAKPKGFWDGDAGNEKGKLLLMHTELSEAAEVMREGDSEYVIKEEHPYVNMEQTRPFSKLEMELADTIIRILDYAEFKGFNIGEAILAKHEINMQRPFKHGGKKF